MNCQHFCCKAHIDPLNYPTEMLATFLLVIMDRTKRLGRGYGNWVIGEQFYDREIELRLFSELMDEGSNVLIVAPRRIGKTSLLREAERRLQSRYLGLQVDLQKASSPADAILELSLATRPHLPIWPRVTRLFSNILDQVAGRFQSLKKSDVTVALRAGINSGNWQSKGDRVLELIARSEKPVIIFLDELPILVNRILKGSDFKITPSRRDVAESLMSWIRNSSIRHQGKIRFVIAGSIGLRPVLQQAGLNATLNNFQSFPLRPWSGEIAIAFVTEMANENNLDLEDGAAELMTSLLGTCIPHYLRMFFEHVYREARLRDVRVVSRTNIEEVYKNEMLGVHGRMELSHYEERLRLLGPAFYEIATELLTEAAVVGQLSRKDAEDLAAEHPAEGKTSAVWSREILSILQHDGYLKETSTDIYAFESKLVRDWWRTSYSKGFKRLAERGK